MLYQAAKRVVDVAASAAGIVLLSPLLAAVAATVGASSPGPVFFSQERVGQGGRKFKLFKFRTMTHRSAGAQITVAGDARVTSIGRLLRRTKIDELPQLWNVLVGDMSLVGPRPEVERYVKIFAKDYAEILRVKPGITDFAAIEYRDEERILAAAQDPEAEYCRVVLPAKIALYRRYIAQQSLGRDFAILVKTIAAILQKV
jgi:lipopolysaccharide/colanic/teichoic acid biosynthesis glycosyltransferase